MSSPASSFFAVLRSLLSFGSTEAPEAAWRIEGKLAGKTKNGELKKAKDLSGIACIEREGFPRRCVVIDDETQSAQIAILKDGSILAGDVIPLIDDTFDGDPVEFDGEGVAYADGAFYVVGSHGHPRDKSEDLDPVEAKREIEARTKACSYVVRIRLDASEIDEQGRLTAPKSVEKSDRLREILKSIPEIEPFMDQRLDENGLTIEGVAARSGRLFIGLRGPVLGPGRLAGIVEVATDAIFGQSTEAPLLHEIDLKRGRGVRDLAAVGDGLLILAGPSGDPPDDEPIPSDAYTLFRRDETGRLTELADVQGHETSKGKWAKPEAILPLGGRRYLTLFDGDGDMPAAVVRDRLD